MAYQDVNIYNLKKTTAAKKMLKIILVASDYNNMGNAKKTVKHIPKLSVSKYLLLFDIRYY